MFFVGAIPSVLVLFLQRLLPESPRWLAARGRYAEAETALRVVEAGTEKALGRKLPPPQRAIAAPPMHSSMADMFGPLYLRRTLVVWVMWFGTYFLNYGLATWMPTLYRTVFHLPLDVALRYQVLTNVVTLFSSFTCAMLIDLTGRRRWFVGAFLGSALALLALWYIGPATPARVLLLGTLSNMCTGTMALAVYLYTPELYPTRSRALAVGTATAWLRLASIIGPIVVASMVMDGLGSVFLVFGLVAFAAAIIVGLLCDRDQGPRAGRDFALSSSPAQRGRWRAAQAASRRGRHSAARAFSDSWINCMMRPGERGASLIFTPKGTSAFSMAEMIAAIAGIVPPSPAPLTPIGLSGEGGFHMMQSTCGNVRRAGQQIFAKIDVQRLRVGVIDHPLEQRIADAMRDAALDLTLAPPSD